MNNQIFKRLSYVVAIMAFFAISTQAQSPVDPNREKAIDSLALEKVKDF